MNEHFADWLHKYMPRYWDSSKKRVVFEQLPKAMQNGLYEEYFKQEGVLINKPLISIDEAFKIIDK